MTKQRWPIQPELRQAMITKLARIVLDPHSSSKEVTAAAKSLLIAEAQNQRDSQTQIEHDDRSRYLEIAQRLGIAGLLGQAPEAGSDCDSGRATADAGEAEAGIEDES